MPPFPSFYDSQRIGALFHPDVARIAAEAAAAALPPSSEDARTVHLLLIDMQVDFCHPSGSLYVPGALGDVQRTVEFIYRNAAHITQITCSLDSHLPSQIFSPNWWADGDGNHPAAGVVARLRGPAGTGSQEAVDHLALSRADRQPRPHAGAVFWHSVARKTHPVWMHKGSIPLTEHYSIVQPEVLVPGVPGGGRNQAFLDELAEADLIVVAGEAMSHCVLETMEDLVEEFADQPEVLRKVLAGGAP